jgi:alpha-D-ribose 1-methylphosphonate 5-triphosphate synthase subunit PhnH
MPVIPTQAIYRQLLQSMSHPGRLFDMPLQSWDSLLCAVCETLFDHEVSYCVLSDNGRSIEEDIFNLTKAERAPLEKADYIIVNGNGSKKNIENAKVGIPSFPDQGATVVYLIDNAAENAVKKETVQLSGPGIKKECSPDLGALTLDEWKVLKSLNSEYPLGVDVICLVGGSQVMSIPRSTRIRIK